VGGGLGAAASHASLKPNLGGRRGFGVPSACYQREHPAAVLSRRLRKFGRPRQRVVVGGRTRIEVVLVGDVICGVGREVEHVINERWIIVATAPVGICTTPHSVMAIGLVCDVANALQNARPWCR
jgi:hypothetical protein